MGTESNRRLRVGMSLSAHYEPGASVAAGLRDTMEQVKLHFATLEEAKAHAEKNGWQYTVEQPHARPIRPKAYADNFAYTRVGRWTH